MRIDIVFDVYRETSIKNAERGHQEVGRLHFKKIIGIQHVKQWGFFQSSGDNKTELIRFLVRRWRSRYCTNEVEVNVAYDTFCVKLRPNDESEPRPELSNNHEEADTRMFLHAKEISESNIRNIVINTPDTDMFLVGITASNQINANLFIRTGTKNKA